VTAAAEIGTHVFYASLNGTLRNVAQFGGGAIILNQDGQDIDVRVETTNSTEALRVNAGLDRVDFNVRQRWANSISPAALTTNVDDYNPTGLDTANIVFVDFDSNAITGIAAGDDGDLLIIYNIGTTSGQLLNEDTNSTAANRITSEGNTDTSLRLKACAWLRYNGSTSRWQQMTHSRN